MAPQEGEVAVPCPEQALLVQMQQFLDEWFYRILASSIGKSWGRQKSVSLLLDIFGMVGMEFAADQKEILISTQDDQQLMTGILAAMPASLKERWESVALQLQTVLHEASRIRTAAEEESGDSVTALFDESGSDRGGLTQQVLKASVIYAAKEVSTYRRIHVSWRKNTDSRIDRLLVATEEAEHAQQMLLAAEAQLSELRGDSKAKSKGVLLNMAEGQNSALVHSVFSGWLGYVERVHAEGSIRKKFTDQIENITQKLIQYKEAQIANIRKILMKGAMEETEVLMHMVMKVWMDEVKQRKDDGDSAELLKKAQDKLAAFDTQQKENAGKFMTRMAAGNDESLKNLCLEAWIKNHQDYAADMEAEEKQKAVEAAFKAHMDAKKDEAKAVMDRMLAGTDHGLMSMIFQNWAAWLKEEKSTKEMEYALMEQQNKFKSLNGRQKAGAHSAQNKVNDQANMNLMQRIMNCWVVETKANRVENHYNTKYESKRRQLQGVQNLFKSFAMQLEQNLGQDEDSSSRTNRQNRKEKRHSSAGGGSKAAADGSVSLPDINQKGSY